MKRDQTLKNSLYEQKLIHFRLVLALAVVAILLSLIIARFFFLQIIHHDDFLTRADSNRIHLQKITPKRGLIYDQQQRILADNKPSFVLSIIRDRAENLDAVLDEVLRLGIIEARDIERFHQRKHRFRSFEATPVSFNLSDVDIAKVAVNRLRLPGVEIKANLARSYPYGNVLAHLAGYVGRINERELAKLDQNNYGASTHIGKTGIEKSYEDFLHGTVGYEYVETNARGEVLRNLESVDAIPGANLELHLDIDLQRVALKALDGRRGVVVALNPKNGGVLAMVSSPSFDPNEFVHGISYVNYNALRDNLDLPLFNRALQAQYPPGSTIKPIMSLAGVEEGTYTLNTTVNDPGWYKIPNNKRLYRDWKRTGHGKHVGFIDAMAESCDVYYYGLAYKLGIDKIHHYYDEFGLGKLTAIDLPGERKGLNPSSAWKKSQGRGAWWPGDSLNIGIGQGFLLATPLQLAYAISIIANKGERLLPQVVAKIGDEVVPPAYLPPLILKNPEHWRNIREAMEAVVHSRKGTARGISRRINYRIAGKTGTAQVVGIAQGEKYDAEALEERNRDHALFVGFAPAEAPEIVVSVIVENGGSGSGVAAPVAKKVIDAHIKKLRRLEAEREKLRLRELEALKLQQESKNA